MTDPTHEEALSVLRIIADNIDAMCCFDSELLDRLEKVLDRRVYTSYVQRSADQKADREASHD